MSAAVPVTGRGRLVRRIVFVAAGSVVSMALGFTALSDAVDLFGRSQDPEPEVAEPAAAATPDGDGSSTSVDEPATDPATEADPVAEAPPAVPGRSTYHARDPFSPVVTTETAVTSASGADATVAPPVTDPEPGTAAPTAPADPATTDPTAATPAPSDPATGCVPNGEAYVCDGTYLALASAGTGAGGELRAVLQVDTSMHEVTAGVALPGGFVVTDITAGCAEVTYRDEALRLCESDRALK